MTSLHRPTGSAAARLLALGLLIAPLAACDTTTADGACSLAFVVTYRHVEYHAEIVLRTSPFRHARPLGVGTVATCHPDDPPQTTRVSAIAGVDPTVALTTPDLPRRVLLSVPVAQAPRSIRTHLRFRY